MWRKSDSKETMDTATITRDVMEIAPDKEIPQLPPLTKEVCLTSVGLREFLSLSRRNTDDILKISLNNLLNHHERNTTSILPYKRTQDKQTQCKVFLDTILYPQWANRVKAIEFCQDQYNSLAKDIKVEERVKLSDEERDRLTRIDPYAIRDLEQKIADQTREIEVLQRWAKNEQEIEDILRERASQVVGDLCKPPAGYSVTAEFIKYMKSI